MSQSTDDANALLDAANKVVEARASLAKAETEFVAALQASSSAAKDEEEEEEEQTEDHWSNYVEYNKSIRTWFVTFGIGAPALFLVNPGLLNGLKESAFGFFIATLFLVGCGVQVALAVLNKLISWHLYCGEQDETFRKSWRYRVADLSNTFLIDTIADLVSLSCFGSAIYLVLQINLKDFGPIASPMMPP